MVASPTQSIAAELLGAVGSLRRRLRRLQGRPPEFGSLTGAQLELARLVGRHPGVSVAEAAAELHVAPNTVSTLVRQLTTAGLVVRSTDGADRRVARLALEPSLQETVETWRDRRALAVGAAIERLSPEDERRLREGIAVLDRLVEEIDDE
jgi:DNA-binding MarR family transcriptional regulator